MQGKLESIVVLSVLVVWAIWVVKRAKHYERGIFGLNLCVIATVLVVGSGFGCTVGQKLIGVFIDVGEHPSVVHLGCGAICWSNG